MVSTRDNSATTESRNQPAPAYTPGPWEFSLSGHYGYSTLWNPATRKEVLTTGGFNDGDYPIVWMGEEASEADLALICAAPDLLEALIRLNSTVDELWNEGPPNFVREVHKIAITAAQRACNAAIAKAEGK